MKGKNKNPDSTVSRSLKLPGDLDAKVRTIAEKEDRSWSYIVVRAIRELVEREEKKS